MCEGMALKGTKARAAKAGAKASGGRGKVRGGRVAQPAIVEREPSESGEEEQAKDTAMPERSDSEVYSEGSLGESGDDDEEVGEEEEEADKLDTKVSAPDAVALLHPPQANGQPPAGHVDDMNNGKNCWLCERRWWSIFPPFGTQAPARGVGNVATK